jgi:DNA primase
MPLRTWPVAGSSALLERERVGYAAGGELIPYLVWRGLSLHAARRVGLLRSDGREHMEGRIVFPECRDSQPVWAIGRALRDDTEPRYLGLPGAGRRGLLGWDLASRDLRGVCIVEGPMDVLALRKWGVPGLALCGTGIGPAMLQEIGRWSRLYVVMDADAAGRDASAKLVEAFGARAVFVTLPLGVKDPADMAVLPNGGTLFARAINQASARVSGCATRFASGR